MFTRSQNNNRSRQIRRAGILGTGAICLAFSPLAVAQGQEQTPGQAASGSLQQSVDDAVRTLTQPPIQQNAQSPDELSGNVIGKPTTDATANRPGESLRSDATSPRAEGLQRYRDGFGRMFFQDENGIRYYAEQPRPFVPGPSWQGLPNELREAREFLLQDMNRFTDGAARRDTPTRLGVGISDSPLGVRIDAVESDSVAAEAGLQPGDTIVSMNGQQVRSAQQLQGMISEDLAGTEASLMIRRGGEEQRLTANFPQQSDFHAMGKPSLGQSSDLKNLREQVQQLKREVDLLRKSLIDNHQVLQETLDDYQTLEGDQRKETSNESTEIE